TPIFLLAIALPFAAILYLETCRGARVIVIARRRFRAHIALDNVARDRRAIALAGIAVSAAAGLVEEESFAGFELEAARRGRRAFTALAIDQHETPCASIRAPRSALRAQLGA